MITSDLERRNNRVIGSYYAQAISELYSGCSIVDMQYALMYYEEEEKYLACEGIKRALDDFMSNSIVKGFLEINESIDGNENYIDE